MTIPFLIQDARQLPFQKEFDVALMLCEGGFPLMETDEMNFEILKNVTAALKENGLFIFTTLNGLFPLHHSIQKFLSRDAEKDPIQFQKNHFDPITFREHFVLEFKDDLGNTQKITGTERYYIPSEITWQLKGLGFQQVEFFGAKLGQFSRKDTLTVDDFEMLVIAKLR